MSLPVYFFFECKHLEHGYTSEEMNVTEPADARLFPSRAFVDYRPGPCSKPSCKLSLNLFNSSHPPHKFDGLGLTQNRFDSVNGLHSHIQELWVDVTIIGQRLLALDERVLRIAIRVLGVETIPPAIELDMSRLNLGNLWSDIMSLLNSMNDAANQRAPEFIYDHRALLCMHAVLLANRGLNEACHFIVYMQQLCNNFAALPNWPSDKDIAIDLLKFFRHGQGLWRLWNPYSRFMLEEYETQGETAIRENEGELEIGYARLGEFRDHGVSDAAQPSQPDVEAAQVQGQAHQGGDLPADVEVFVREVLSTPLENEPSVRLIASANTSRFADTIPSSARTFNPDVANTVDPNNSNPGTVNPSDLDNSNSGVVNNANPSVAPNADGLVANNGTEGLANTSNGAANNASPNIADDASPNAGNDAPNAIFDPIDDMFQAVIDYGRLSSPVGLDAPESTESGSNDAAQESLAQPTPGMHTRARSSPPPAALPLNSGSTAPPSADANNAQHQPPAQPNANKRPGDALPSDGPAAKRAMTSSNDPVLYEGGVDPEQAQADHDLFMYAFGQTPDEYFATYPLRSDVDSESDGESEHSGREDDNADAEDTNPPREHRKFVINESDSDSVEGSVDGSVEGSVDGSVDGPVEGSVNGSVEGSVDGSVEESDPEDSDKFNAQPASTSADDTDDSSEDAERESDSDFKPPRTSRRRMRNN